MSGPAPKLKALRQRRNKKTTAAELPAEGRKGPAPALPKRHSANGQFVSWHALTKEWWKDLWRSPMAAKFMAADVHNLYLLADLIDAYWKDPSTQLAAEIRQHRMAYGLTPLDRQRLQWALVEEPEDGKRTNSGAAGRVRKGGDTRELLRAVK